MRHIQFRASAAKNYKTLAKTQPKIFDDNGVVLDIIHIAHRKDIYR